MRNKPDLFNLPWMNSLTTSSPLFTSHSLIKPIHEQYGEETVKLFHRLIGVGLPTFSTLKKIHTFKIQGIVKLPRIDQKLRPLPTPSQGPPPPRYFFWIHACSVCRRFIQGHDGHDLRLLVVSL